MSANPGSVGLAEFLADRMIARLEAQPLTVELLLADGTVTMEVGRKHRWFKVLSQRRAEQLKRLRESLKANSESA